MGSNTQTRKWTLVVNNPLEAGLDHSAIAETLQKFVPAYYCMADEIATTGTYHTHIFLYTPSPVRFSTIKNRFPTAHIEKAYGTVRENRAYIRKEGKWADTDKAETAVPDTFLEWGNLPAEQEEQDPKMYRLVQDVRAGMSTTEIIDASPNLAFRVRDIDLLRQTLTAEQYSVENRPLEVSYIFGASGTGTRRGVSMNSMTRAAFAVSPTTGPQRGFPLTATTGRTCWYLRSSTVRFPLRICSTIWTFTLCTFRPGTVTGWLVTQKFILLQIYLWKNSTGRNSGKGRKHGGRSCAAFIL